MNTIIEVSNLTVRYGQSEAVKDVSFKIEKGDFVGLSGRNGAGKTTLIKALLGLLPAYSGVISLFGKPQKEFKDFGKIGYLPQKHSSINHLFPATVEDIVLLGLLSTKTTPKIVTRKDKQSVEEVLEKLKISKLKNKLLSELSGGQQQRVLLARAIVSKPDLLIFDEPSTALDPASRAQFFEMISGFNKNDGITVILITHDTGYIGEYANKLLYIDQKLIHFGKLSEFCPSGELEACFQKSDKHIIWHQHN